LCTQDRQFTIRASADCRARGFDRAGFFKVDVGQRQRGANPDAIHADIVDRP
jgi:uncharacterized membrane protein